MRLLSILPPLLACGSCTTTHLGNPIRSDRSSLPPGSGQAFSVQEDLAYTPPSWPSQQVGDLYLPEPSAPQAKRPAVLLIHGGSWAEPERRSSMAGIAEKLAACGYVVFNATYRLTPEWQFPAPVEDLRQAVRWLRQHAEAYQIHPDQIATYGYSAGGHLAALTGLMPGPPDTRIQAVVAGGAPSDLTFYPGGDIVPLFLGGTISEIPGRFREASPVNHVDPNDPPVFLFHGSNDKLVPPEHPLAFYEALQRSGVPRELLWLENRNHITGFVFGDQAESTAIAFLDRVFEIDRSRSVAGLRE